MKNIVVNLALLAASLSLAFVLSEWGLRKTAYRSVLTHYKYPKGYYSNNPDYGYDITPGFRRAYHVLTDLSYPVWSNSLGCFDREYENEKSFIYLGGDSFTWGYAPLDKKFGTLIENLLSTRVLKCGVSGFGTRQEYLKSRRVLGKIGSRPKLIILGYFVGNDFEDDYTFPNYAIYDGYRVQVRYMDSTTGEVAVKDNLKERYRYFRKYCSPRPPQNPALERAVCFLRRHSIVFNLLKGRLRRLQKRFASKKRANPGWKLKTPEVINNWRRNAFQEHLANLGSFKKLASEYGSSLLVVVIPEKEQVYTFLKHSAGHLGRDVTDLKAFMKNERIDFVDLTPFFLKYADITTPDSLNSGGGLYLANDHHWTSKGDYLAGLVITRAILEKNLLAVSGRENILSLISKKLSSAFATQAKQGGKTARRR